MQTMQKFLACFFALFFFNANAQPSLLKDINVSLANGSPQGMTTVGTTVFFSATESTHGSELWKSDGTVAGTVLVKDINPGSGDAFPRNFCNVNGTLFFTASDGFQGTELWKSDGTANGTVMVKDIAPGANNSAPSQLFAVGNTVFFAAFHATKGYELWKSDGTEAGTVFVRDINPNGANSNPSNFTFMNNALFFAANSTEGRELWKLDLVTGLVIQVKDIHTNGDAQPENLTVFNGQLFFSATSLNNGVADRELWKSTGVIGNATLVKNINAAASSSPHQLKVFNGALFFAAQSQNNGVELYKSDGTTAGTPSVPSFDIIPGQGSSSPFNLTVANNTLFFAATSTANGRELWKVTTNNTPSEVKNIVAGSNGSFPQALITVGTTLFFTANNGINGRELWKSNAEGTDMVQDIVTGPANSDISEIDLCARGTDLFFSSKGNGTVGIELRRSNGSLNSVVLVRNIGQAGSFPREFVKMGNFTFFSADDGITGRSLWKTDGTELGTVMIGAAGINPTELTVVTNGNTSTLFFVGGGFRQIFKSNGTTAGTGAVQTQLIGGVGQNPTNLTAFQGKLFFTATNGFINPNGVVTEDRLFKSDGTQDGTQQVTGSPLDPRNLTVAGDKLFCSATDDQNGRELWRTTVNGVPFMVKNIRADNASSNPSNLIAIGSTLFFTANLGVNGVELFKSNGLLGNATVLSNFAAADPLMGEFTNFNGRLFFTTPSSGIAGFTNIQRVNTALTGIETVLTGSSIFRLRAAGTTLFFFQAFHHGVVELSKITTASNIIVPLANFPEGNTGIATESIVAGKNLFFTMNNAATGHELWKSNGTITGLVSDIRPGVGNSNVHALAVCGTDLFFSANNLVNGQEPWKLANATAAQDDEAGEREAEEEIEAVPSLVVPEIKVYPNPTSNYVNVDLPQNEMTGTLSIVSASGQLVRSVQSSEGEASIQLDVQDLPKGVYLVRWVQSDDQIVVKKLIVQ
jgi:ELWxxDGT repeat protein